MVHGSYAFINRRVHYDRQSQARPFYCLGFHCFGRQRAKRTTAAAAKRFRIQSACVTKSITTSFEGNEYIHIIHTSIRQSIATVQECVLRTGQRYSSYRGGRSCADRLRKGRESFERAGACQHRCREPHLKSDLTIVGNDR